MTSYLADPDFTLYNGDALETLRGLPSESVHCALTSPPFYALRDYGVEGQIGLEATPEAWCDALVSVFRELRRVLRKDGTLWVECGDSYNAYNGNRGASASISAAADAGRNETPRGLTTGALKPKDLLGQPWLLAFALRADGWYLRQCIVWHKPNAMPESATDRCTTAHSYLFLFSRSPRYFFDADAISEEAASGTDLGLLRGRSHEGPGADGARVSWHAPSIAKRQEAGVDSRNGNPSARKNARSVWTIPTQGYAEAHFATWPEALVERIILAGTSERGCCPECGAPWEREVEMVSARDTRPGVPIKNDSTRKDSDHRNRRVERTFETIGWRPTCDHYTDFGRLYECPVVPCTVLDPFSGAGTTALVARRLGRRSVGIELNADYCALAARRLQQMSLLAA